MGFPTAAEIEAEERDIARQDHFGVLEGFEPAGAICVEVDDAGSWFFDVGVLEEGALEDVGSFVEEAEVGAFDLLAFDGEVGGAEVEGGVVLAARHDDGFPGFFVVAGDVE